MPDFVKVLDFGLVKAVEGEQAGLTSANADHRHAALHVARGGQSPDQVDARSDLYAVGAVGYFLLTGTPVFTGSTVMEICMKHVQAEPQPPSLRLGRPVNASLEKLVLRCLAKIAGRSSGRRGRAAARAGQVRRRRALDERRCREMVGRA